MDTLIVGAGPAGSAAAIRLASAGRETLVIDKARFPREKICGDGLTTGALRHLDELGVDISGLASTQRVDHVDIRGPRGRRHDFDLPDTGGWFAAVVPRSELDAAIVDRARAVGAQVAEGHALESVRSDAASVVAEVKGLGTVTAAHLIAADGMWSPTRKMLGLDVPTYRGEFHAFRQYVSGVSDAASRALFVSFDADLLPGYFWSFPLPGGRANIGYGVLRGHGPPTSSMTRLWKELTERPHIVDFLGDAWQPDGPHRAWPIPARIGRLPTSYRRTMFVGDAAGACDVMTGEGIGQALASGMAAADAVVETAHDTPSRRGNRYDRWIRANLVPDDRMSRWLSSVLSHPLGAEAALRIVGSTHWTRHNFARWLFEDYARGIALTPRAWRRGALSGPGALRTEA